MDVESIATLTWLKESNEKRAKHTESTVVFPKEDYKIGDFVNVQINDCTSATLKGVAVGYSDNN